MNNARRKSINKIISDLAIVRNKVEEFRDEETEAMNAIEERFGDTSRYDEMSEATYNLDAALNSIEEAMITLEDAIS